MLTIGAVLTIALLTVPTPLAILTIATLLAMLAIFAMLLMLLTNEIQNNHRLCEKKYKGTIRRVLIHYTVMRAV